MADNRENASKDKSEEQESLTFSSKDAICDVIPQISTGDALLIGDRSLPMEVFDTDQEKIGSDPHPTDIVYLELRGRTYRLRGGTHKPDGELSGTPMLEIRQEDGWETKSRLVTTIKIDNDQQIISDTRAKEWLDQYGISIC